MLQKNQPQNNKKFSYIKTACSLESIRKEFAFLARKSFIALKFTFFTYTFNNVLGFIKEHQS